VERKESLEEEAEAVRETISELETNVADTEELRDSDLLRDVRANKRITVRAGPDPTGAKASVEDEIEEIESLPDKPTLQEQLDEIRQELNYERGRVAELESESVSKFNEHMDEVLDILNYRNISRVWIERKEAESGSHGSDSTFDLHLVRESDTGSVYEDTVANLSESEREVIGLIVALAGYLVHEVYQHVPFMLLDSLEAIDSDRIADLIDYFSEYAPYLMVALLPEDASGITDKYTQITAAELN